MISEMQAAGWYEALSRTHTVRYGGSDYLLDGETLLVAAVPRVVADAVHTATLCRSAAEWLAQLHTSFAEADVADLTAALEALSRAGAFVCTDTGAAANEERARLARISASPQLAHIDLFVTSDCTLRCVYCYSDHGQFQGASRSPHMSLSVVRAAMARLLAATPDIEAPGVTLLGGEPLMHPQIGELLRYIRDAANAAGKPLALTLSTNGTILTPGIVDAIRYSDANVGISVDGTEDVHNSQRPYASGAGSFQAICRTIDRLAPTVRKGRLSITLSCTPRNVASAADYRAHLQERFPGLRVSVAPMHVAASDQLAWQHDSAELYRQLWHRITDIEAAVPLSPAAVAAKLRGNLLHARRKRLFMCRFGLVKWAISVDGDIYPCAALVGDAQYLMGNVQAGDVALPEAVSRGTQFNVLSRGECESCWAKWLCAGGCLGINAVTSGALLESTAALCAMYRADAEKELIALIATYKRRDLGLPPAVGMCGPAPVV